MPPPEPESDIERSVERSPASPIQPLLLRSEPLPLEPVKEPAAPLLNAVSEVTAPLNGRLLESEISGFPGRARASASLIRLVRRLTALERVTFVYPRPARSS